MTGTHQGLEVGHAFILPHPTQTRKSGRAEQGLAARYGLNRTRAITNLTPAILMEIAGQAGNQVVVSAVDPGALASGQPGKQHR